MRQTNNFGSESNAVCKFNRLIRQFVQLCLNVLDLLRIMTDTQNLLNLRVHVFVPFSVALLIIKCISVWCITLLSVQGL